MVAFGNPVAGEILPIEAASDPPTFRVTRSFADGSMPQYGPHDGLDIGNADTGADILAMRDGRVYQAFFDGASGGAGIVRIDHGDGWTTGYAHMDAIYVAAGQNVREGDRIARLDNTGWSTAAHLHFDTTEGSVRKDPWPLLRQNQEGSAEVGFGPYPDDEYDRVQNVLYRALEGANFRADTNTNAEVYKSLDAGQEVRPYAKVKGEGVNDSRWWFLAFWKVGGEYREGAFHSSTLEKVGPDQNPPDAVPADVAQAAASAADDVRDAGRAALNEAASKYTDDEGQPQSAPLNVAAIYFGVLLVAVLIVLVVTLADFLRS